MWKQFPRGILYTNPTYRHKIEYCIIYFWNIYSNAGCPVTKDFPLTHVIAKLN